jgi:hypothetical protein
MNNSAFQNMGADHFFGKLPDEVVKYYRSLKKISYGFPSGHSSNVIAMWGSILVTFKRNWLIPIAVFFILTGGFSRLYLGHHFLIDVIGGLALGAILVFGNFYYIKYAKFIAANLLDAQLYLKCFNFCYLLIPSIILLLLTKSISAGQLLGLNLGIFFIINTDSVPQNKGTLTQRILRIILAFVIYIIVNYFVSISFDLISLREIKILRILRHIFTCFLVIWGSTKLFLRIGLYKKK